MSKELIQKYAEQKKNLKKYFEEQKVGTQNLYIDQTKFFKPIIDTQKESSKEIGNKIVSNQETLTNTLDPFVNEVKRRADQMEALQGLPFYDVPKEIEAVHHSTPIKNVIDIDLDGELLEKSHQENLSFLELELPSVVQKKGNIESVFETIKSRNRKLAQLLKENNEKTKREGLREHYESQKKTLTIYTKKIKGLEGTDQFIKKSGEGLRKLCKQKRGRGRPRKYPDTIYYNNPEDLCYKLEESVASKRGGNTGEDNNINEMLDELLNTGRIDKDYYNKLYKYIFPNYK